MRLEQADQAAAHVVELLRPLCRRVEVAGSVRRRCPEVSDLEILCLPDVNRYLEFQALVATWPQVKGQPDGRYTRRRLHRWGLDLDLFVQNTATWACNLLIRTGCQEFSKAVVTLAKQRGFQFQDARLWQDGRVLQVAEELEVFQAIGIPWHDPPDRTLEAAQVLLGQWPSRRPPRDEAWLLR